MSVHTVQEFWKQVGQDVDLQTKLEHVSMGNPAEAAAAVARIGTEAGFVFTPDEYETIVQAELAREHAAGELDERELEQVAGGRIPRSITCSFNCTTVYQSCD
jgi:predicted ribosomally synthesized peptide with nif11-like leader